MHITGVQIGYYFHCKRQLWLFAHSLQMEQENENVSIGKLITENSYRRERHEIDVADELNQVGIRIDFFNKQSNTIHEIKKTDSFEESHQWQVLYYIYVLKEKGIANVKGEIDYPKMKKKVEVILTEDKEEELLKVLRNIRLIINKEEPFTVVEAKVKIFVCKKCSYYELCYS